MINSFRKFIRRVLKKKDVQGRLIEGFEELDEQGKIDLIKDLLREEPSEKRNNKVQALNKKLDRDLFIKLVLSILKEFNSRDILDKKVSREEIEEYLMERMKIFRWENVENFEMISRKIIINQLAQDNPVSKSNKHSIEYFTSLTQGIVEESEISLSKDGDMKKFNYNSDKSLQHKFNSINIVEPEARLFINKILKKKNSEKRIYKLAPYTSLKTSGKPRKSSFYIFCTEEKIEYINQYLHYEKLDYEPSKRTKSVNKEKVFFMN